MAERILKLKTKFGIHWECDLLDWQPMNDSVFIERLEPMLKPQNGIITVANDSKAPILRKGVILSCGPKVTDVSPGDKVLFNARWNDLAHAELKPIGSDAKSRTAPLERPLSYRFDPKIHLVQEADIAGIIHEPLTIDKVKDDPFLGRLNS